ncbi:MAG TPA: secondary thiamine-phosphate synthase enzyme YjbQ [Longimicrobium sp.]
MTRERNALVEITAQVDGVVRRSGVREGMVVVQSLHTTAALTVNENADPDVVHDVLGKMDELVPHAEPYYRHAEGNSDSHVKTSLFGPSLTLIVSDGRPLLGRWQGIYLCEWDGPRERTVAVQVMAAGLDEEPRIIPDMHAPR